MTNENGTVENIAVTFLQKEERIMPESGRMYRSGVIAHFPDGDLSNEVIEHIIEKFKDDPNYIIKVQTADHAATFTLNALARAAMFEELRDLAMRALTDLEYHSDNLTSYGEKCLKMTRETVKKARLL